MESTAWEIVSIGVLLLILASFIHFWMSRFGKTKWMKSVGGILSLCLYWILFGFEHPQILAIVIITLGARVLIGGQSEAQ